MDRKKSSLFCLNLICALLFYNSAIVFIYIKEINFAMKLSQPLVVMRCYRSSSSNLSLVFVLYEYSEPDESSREKRLLLVTPIGAARYSKASFKHVSNIYIKQGRKDSAKCTLRVVPLHQNRLELL